MPLAAAAIKSINISGLFQNLKDAANAFHEAKNLELYQRMTDVYGNVVELVEKNRVLLEENRALQERLNIQGELRFDQSTNALWREHEGQTDGPFCSACWEIDHKLVHRHKGFIMDVEISQCPKCDLKRA